MSAPAQPYAPVAYLLTQLRKRAHLTVFALAEATGASFSHIRHITNGRYGASPELLSRICRVLKATDEEVGLVLATAERMRDENAVPPRAKLERARSRRRVRLPLADGLCTGNCDRHDGRMAPEDLEDQGEERDSECVHYGHCLDKLGDTFPNAKSAHCPPQCTKRLHADPAALRARRIAEATGGGSWTGMTFPSGFPGKGRPKRAA